MICCNTTAAHLHVWWYCFLCLGCCLCALDSHLGCCISGKFLYWLNAWASMDTKLCWFKVIKSCNEYAQPLASCVVAEMHAQEWNTALHILKCASSVLIQRPDLLYQVLLHSKQLCYRRCETVNLRCCSQQCGRPYTRLHQSGSHCAFVMYSVADVYSINPRR